jgi:hypothetical protein
MKGKLNMSLKKLAVGSIVILYILFAYNTLLSENTEPTPQEKQEYKNDSKRVDDLRASLRQNDAIDFNTYKGLADSIEQKWSGRNKEYYAILTLKICSLLSNGTFKEYGNYDLIRKYALSALEEPDSIPLQFELDLASFVSTLHFGKDTLSGDVYAERRTKDTEIRLHGWKRLLDTIDPNWDPSPESLYADVPTPAGSGLPAGIAPSAIKDSAMRAEYEQRIRLKSETLKKYNEQYECRKWLEIYPPQFERYIIFAYSHPPYNTKELETLLNEYQIDQETKTRIIEAVEKNIKEAQQGTR